MSPQTTRMQRMQEYFKRAYFLPFIDYAVSCIAQLDERFTRQKAVACQLNTFLPAFLNSSKYDDIGPDSFCRTVVSSR
jgi:hypothetical protein